MASPLAERYARIRAEVGSATLIAVTKGQPLEKLVELWELGQRDFGENYVQELQAKAAAFAAAGREARWHFIGKLQSNKIKALLPIVHAIHSVGSAEHAREIDRRANAPVRCFIEVNLDDEPQKGGVAPTELPALLTQLGAMPNLRVEGLMCIPDPARDSAAAFARLAELARSHGLVGLSMGMSSDYAAALAAGSTHVRVGTALLGERRPL